MPRLRPPIRPREYHRRVRPLRGESFVTVPDEEGADPMTSTGVRGRLDLSVHGIRTTGDVHHNPSTSTLYEHAIERGDARIAEGGPMAVDTGVHTGRSAQDKFIVREPPPPRPPRPPPPRTISSSASRRPRDASGGAATRSFPKSRSSPCARRSA